MICIFFDVFLSKINSPLDAGRKLNLHETLSALCITAQKITFSIKNFFGECDQIHRKLRIWSHLLKKALMKNFIFCAVYVQFTSCVQGQDIRKNI